MLTLDRRTLLKSFGSAAALAAVANFAPRKALAGPEFLTQIYGADESDPLTPTLTKLHVGIRKVAPNLYVLLGAGGNIGVFDSPDGAIVIDSGVPDRAKDVTGAIQAVAKFLPHTLINTHYHYDHTGGNAAVQALGYRIVGQDAVRKHLSEKTTIEFLNASFDPVPEAARPTATFDQHLTIYVKGETLRLVHVAPAHTDSDIYIHFEKANVLQTGDLFFNGFFPMIDYSTRGSLDGMIAAEEKLLALVDDQTKIIPGHGPVGTKADLQAAFDMLNQVRDIMKPLAASGKSVDEVVAAKPLQAFDEKWSKGFLNTEMFTKLIYMIMTQAAKK